MTKILVPTDFSTNAKDALKYAIHLSHSKPTIIKLLHVISVSYLHNINNSANNDELVKLLKEEADKKMKNLVFQYNEILNEKNLTNIQLESNVIVGEIVQSIKIVADEFNATLILMGTMGENHNLLEKFIGTISTSIIDKPSCPIILIPKAYYYNDIRNIIFSTSLEQVDSLELHRALHILKPHSPSVRCIYVQNNEEDLSGKANAFAKYMVDHSPSIQTTFIKIEGKNIPERISEQANIYNADLIIMKKSKKNFIQRMFTKNHVKPMVNLLNRPMLILN